MIYFEKCFYIFSEQKRMQKEKNKKLDKIFSKRVCDEDSFHVLVNLRFLNFDTLWKMILLKYKQSYMIT